MKLEAYKTKLIFAAILLFSIFLFSTSAFAAGLVPCGLGLSTDSGFKACTFCDFFVLIQNIINFLLEVFASLATLMAIYIAFLFMFSGGSPAKITDAKGKLWLLIIGIFWVLGSWLVLNTILNFAVDPSKFPLPWYKINCSVSQPSSSSPTSGGGGGGTGGTGGGGTGGGSSLFEPGGGAVGGAGASGTFSEAGLSEQEARNQLQQAGITVNKNSCPTGVSYQNVSGGCTSLSGVKTSTMEGAVQLKNECQCSLEITGGTELGHAQGMFSHANGYKLDFQPNPALDQYIQNNFKSAGLRSDGVKQYTAPDGTLIAREGDHWDATFVRL